MSGALLKGQEYRKEIGHQRMRGKSGRRENNTGESGPEETDQCEAGNASQPSIIADEFEWNGDGDIVVGIDRARIT